MNPQTPDPTTPSAPIQNPLAVMQPGETVICEIKRHPIGILSIYVMAGLLLVAVAVVCLIVAPHYITGANHAKATSIGALIFVAVAVAVSLFVLISNRVYWGNRWVLTSDSLTQITQTSLFDKQSSQLSLGNLEDVTAEQNGILTHMFNYGLLRVETAGERSKFSFAYCPNPNAYAQKVLAAREVFEQGRRGEDQRLYRQPAPVATGAPTDPDGGVNIGA